MCIYLALSVLNFSVISPPVRAAALEQQIAEAPAVAPAESPSAEPTAASPPAAQVESSPEPEAVLPVEPVPNSSRDNTAVEAKAGDAKLKEEAPAASGEQGQADPRSVEEQGAAEANGAAWASGSLDQPDGSIGDSSKPCELYNDCVGLEPVGGFFSWTVFTLAGFLVGGVGVLLWEG